MIVVDKSNRSPRYLVNEKAISFTENYQGVNQQGNPIYDVVAVSIASNAAIMVYDENNGIGYGNDLQYQRWRLSGATTGLVSAEAHNIYARLSRGDEKKADVIFSVRNYNTDGSVVQEDGTTTDPSDTHFYILIGTLTALADVDAAPSRTLTFDPGYLSSQKSNNEQVGSWVAEMFDLVRGAESIIRAKLRFETLRVKGEAIFASVANFYNGLKIGSSDSGKIVTSVATDLSTKEDSSESISTPAYVKAFSEARYLRYDIQEKQDVAGPVHFSKNVTVGGDLDVAGNQSVAGNQTIAGTQEVTGVQTLHEGFMTQNFSDAAGQITGAQLTGAGVMTVSGLKAMSFEVFELIYNKIRAQGGKMVLSPAGTVEACRYKLKDSVGGSVITPDDYYAEESAYTLSDIEYVLITIKKDEFNDGLIPFAHNDILYGYVNQIGGSGQYARGGQSCMYILSTNDEIAAANKGEGDGKMTVRAVLFDEDVTDENGKLLYDNDNQVVGNMPPTNGMSLAQRGNINAAYPERMTSFFIDSMSGNIVMLQNVMTPRINKGHYATVLGQLPTDLYNEFVKYFPQLRAYDPVTYSKYGIFENIIQIDHLGNPIQRENNRGLWDAETATDETIDESLDDSRKYVNRYKNLPSYYDTVTHNGSLWKCVENDTTDEPGKGDGWLMLVSKGNTAPIYEFRISPTSIYVDGNGVVNSSMLYMSVGETSGDGFTILAVQSQLDERNLKIQYSVDDGETRTDVLLSQSVIETEDSSGILSSEEELAFMLEGEGVIIDKSWDKITLYLVDTVNGIDRLAHDVPITKSGTIAQGNLLPNSNFDLYEEDGTTLKNWSVQLGSVESNYYLGQNAYFLRGINKIFLSADTEAFKSQSGSDFVLSFYLYKRNNANHRVTFLSSQTGTDLPLTVIADKCTVTKDTDKIYVDVETIGHGVWGKVVIKIRTYANINYPLSISFEVTNASSIIQDMTHLSMIKLEANDVATPYQKAQSDLVGPAGEAGDRLYSAGVWKSDVLYAKEGKNVPFVYYDEDEDDDIEGGYYILKAGSASGEDQSPTNTEYWDPFDKYDAVNVNFLMANWAKFGSKAGGVFYDRYLFSQYGLSFDGVFGRYTKDMFSDGVLNGEFQPNLFLDFFNGAIKGNKMSETFKEFEYISKTILNEEAEDDSGDTWSPDVDSKLITPCNVLDTDSGYNVSIEPDKDVSLVDYSDTGANHAYKINESGLLLSMPLVNNIYDSGTILESKAPWEPDGMKVTILVRENDKWNKIVQHAEGVLNNGVSLNSAYVDNESLTSGVVLCADQRVINQKSYQGKDYQGATYISFNPGDYDTSDSIENAKNGGFFVVKGRICKFLFIEPGMMVRLRSCTCSKPTLEGGKLPLWYVENSDDFVEVDARVVFQGRHYWQSGSMKQYPTFGGVDDYDNPITVNHYAFDYGHYYAGTQGTGFAFKNYAFATRGIADVYSVAKEYANSIGEDFMGGVVYISTRGDRYGGSIESDVYKISCSDPLMDYGSSNSFSK